MLFSPINDTTCVRCGAGEIGYGTKDEPTCVKVYGHCDACMDEPERVGTISKADATGDEAYELAEWMVQSGLAR